uniref:Uncharacterized protein n=1 Tax=Phytophthora ramorum TaxID=164328 RepID=H3HDE7_PHYRM
MSADSSPSLQALEGEVQSPLQSAELAVDPPVKISHESAPPKRIRRRSKALSISSLSDESSADKNSVTAKAIAVEACHDVDRELAAIETRLSVFRGRRRRQDSGTYESAVVPLQSKNEDDAVHSNHDEIKENEPISPSSSASSNAVGAASPTFSKLSEAHREAGAVADQVATTLLKCDQLLQRVKSCESSRQSELSNSSRSSAPSPTWDVKNGLAIEDEEAILTQKAATVKRFAARCQRDIETSTTKIEVHHQQMQTAFLKELQRKYDSKKHLTLMALRERYEKETKAIVRTKMEEYEFEEAAAVKEARATLLGEHNRALQELQSSHNAAREESLSQLELQLTTETERDKRELGNQLEEELTMRLKQMQEASRESFRRWEIEQREQLDQELYNHREAAVASVLKAQEERIAMLKQEMQTSHFEKEEAELEKLKKALAFGAQAQLQQLRKRLETEHEEKVADIKAETSLSLEKETEELKQMLTRSHREQQDQLKRDLDTENRVSIMELHDSMQTAHQKSLQALKDAAEQRRADALVTHRQDFELECRQELQILEQTLDQEMSAAAHLFELKKHLSKELAQYVDVMVGEFDELAEEQSILVAKITESTQLYLSFKRQCGVLQAQSTELTSGLEILHDQLQKKDLVCKKLYQANEALLKRLQAPALQASVGPSKKEPPSPRVLQSPALKKSLGARAKASKAHQEREQAQAATAELRKYVDSIETRQQQLWEDRTTHVAEIVQLRDKLAEKVEECFLIETECAKLNKQVKMLQSESEIDEVLTKVSESYEDEIKATQLHEIVTLKEEGQLMVTQLHDREQELKKVSADLEESQKVAQFEKEQHSRENKLWLEKESEHRRRTLELEQSLGDMRVLLEDQKKAHQNELQLIQETNQQLRSNVTAKESTIQALGRQHKTESSAREKKHQTLVAALKVRIEQKVADINRFRVLVEKQTAEKDANSLMRKRVEDLECHVQALTEEKSQLAEANELQQQRAEDFARCERDKVVKEEAVEKQSLSGALHVAEQHNRSMQIRISEVEAELAEQVSQMQKQARSHASALERLLESSLRLTKSKNTGDLISVECRSTPQEHNIKRVIENDVLPLFTSVFLQGDDNASPQGDVPMTRWLQDLLHDMQARIAAQLESIYSTAAVKSIAMKVVT